MQNTFLDDLEIEYGTAILSDLTGQPLTRNQQMVRLFDQTKHSAEYYFRADAQTGKPYVQDFQNGKRYYPVTAYCQAYGVDFVTALADLRQRHYGGADLDGATQRSRPVFQPAPPPPVDYLLLEQYKRCQTRLDRNGLYEYLRFTYGTEKAEEVFARYRLGTSRRWQYLGYLSTCLPQFDLAGNLRQVKIIPFDAMNGRRIKKYQQAQIWSERSHQYEPTALDSDKTYFAGRQMAKDAGKPDVYLQQCFFGEHLLAEYPHQVVALVEGESTAIVCSLLWPQFIWLATGGSHGARWTSPETFGVLQGRDVILWPDNDAYEEWREKAIPLRPLVKSLRVTDYVKKNAPENGTKADLRDLLTHPCLFSGHNRTVLGEILAIVPCDDYPAIWDAPAPKPTPKPLTNSVDFKSGVSKPVSEGFPRAPLAVDALFALRRIHWSVIPDGVAEEDYNPELPTLMPSPNRERFANLLGLTPDQLPLYQIAPR